jgi:hypothetical protein
MWKNKIKPMKINSRPTDITRKSVANPRQKPTNEAEKKDRSRNV